MLRSPQAVAVRLSALLLAIVVRAAAQPAPTWTRGATCYEIFVRSFADGDGDGIGDIPGLIAKLDYVNDGDPRSTRSLGARCIWLMPVVEAPSYHGYDATDYFRVDREYGTDDDFKRLTAEAHRRGIRVLVDMVLNHTSDRHPNFQAALRDTTSPFRAWYRFARARPTEPGPWGQNRWVKSPVRDEWYYAVFDRTMPDLDYATPAVRAEATRIARFWLEEMGVDGFRLDAIPYLVEEPGVPMNAPGTHAFLREYEAVLRTVKRDVFTIGEVFFPNDTLRAYYPDQLDGYFAFEVSDSLIAAVRRGSAKGMLAPVLQLQREVPTGRWSPFLRNHDQPRTRTELGGDRAKARLASLLLLTMPGLPFVYYGEEIGMLGAKPDERIRTPMQWSATRGGGFTRGTPWERLADDSLTTTVASQAGDPRSLLALHRRLIHLRAENTALGVGALVPLAASDEAVAAYVRRDGERVVLVVANLGTTARERVTLSSGAGALPAGTWTPRDLLGGARAAALRVGADGTVGHYLPLQTLAPTQGYVFDLRRAGRDGVGVRSCDGAPYSGACAPRPLTAGGRREASTSRAIGRDARRQ